MNSELAPLPDSTPGDSARQAVVRGGLQLLASASPTEFAAEWIGPPPRRWLRYGVPPALSAVFLWLFAWPVSTVLGDWFQKGWQFDFDTIILAAVTVIGGSGAWSMGRLLGDLCGYWSWIHVDPGAKVLELRRHGWLFFGRSQRQIPLDRIVGLRFQIGKEGRGRLPITCKWTIVDEPDGGLLMIPTEMESSASRLHALELFFALGRSLGGTGFFVPFETPRGMEVELAFPGREYFQPAPYADDDEDWEDEDFEADELDDDDQELRTRATTAEPTTELDADDDEEEETRSRQPIAIMPLPDAADMVRAREHSAAAATFVAPPVDQGLAQRVDPAALSTRLEETRLTEWRPGELVRFERSGPPTLVYFLVVAFGAAAGAGIGGWPIYGLVSGLLRVTPWWPGALVLSACLGGFLTLSWSLNQFRARVLTFDWKTQRISWRSGSIHDQRSFAEIRHLVLSGTDGVIAQGTESDNQGATARGAGCRLDLVLADRDLLVVESPFRAQSADEARQVLQPLADSLAQALDTTCTWEFRRQGDPGDVRRNLSLTRPQQAVVGALVLVAVVALGRDVARRQYRLQAEEVVQQAGGEAVKMDGFSIRDIDVYRDYWNVRVQKAPDPDRCLEVVQPYLGSLGDLGVDGEDSPLTDRGMQHLAGLEQLRVLQLAGSRIGDEGLQALRGCRGLVYLNASLTLVTDDGLRALEGLPQLRFLYLGGTRITDQGLEVITTLPALQFLHLARTEVTAEGIARLRRARPGIEISQ